MICIEFLCEVSSLVNEAYMFAVVWLTCVYYMCGILVRHHLFRNLLVRCHRVLVQPDRSLPQVPSTDRPYRPGLARLKSCVPKLAPALYTSAVLIALVCQADLPLAAPAATPTAGAEDRSAP